MFKIKKLSIVILLVGSLTIVGCQNTYDVEEPDKVKIDVPSEEKETGKEKLNEEEYKKEEMGQCYDCGEYYPVKNMTFNGRSYHCGCVDNREYCEYCSEEGHTEESCKWKVYDEELGDAWVCSNCGRENVGQVLCECELEELQ